MASSQRLLRRLGGLGRQLFSSTSTTGETMQSALADLTLLPADTEPALRLQRVCRTAEAMQQAASRSFAANGLQHRSQPAPLPSLLQHMTHRLHQPTDGQLCFEHSPAPPPPQSLTNLKYGGEETWLTSGIVLTPLREGDRVKSPPSGLVPLRADSVRRKRKHKMNKHKHKKRRKLQRHKN